MLGEGAGIHDYAEVLIGRPQPSVEHPVSVLGKREAVTEFVILRLCPPFDMCGIYDGGSIACDVTVASERAGEAILRAHPHGEARIAAFAFGGVFCLFHQSARGFLAPRAALDAEALEKCGLFARRKVFRKGLINFREDLSDGAALLRQGTKSRTPPPRGCVGVGIPARRRRTRTRFVRPYLRRPRRFPVLRRGR